MKLLLDTLTLSAPFLVFMTKAITGYGITPVPMTLDDCAAYEQLRG
jgi:hypothetical protein